MSATPMQHWLAECQFDGRASFWVGSFSVPARETEQVARKKAEQLAMDFMNDIFPEWLSPPKVLRLVPGAMIMVFDDEDTE